MLTNRHFISYFSTILLYVMMIGGYFYLQGQTKISTQSSEEKVMQVRLADFVPETPPADDTPLEEVIEPEVIKEPLPKEEEKIVEEEIIEPEVIKEPQPIEEEKVVEEVIPESIVKPQPPLPRPVIQKPVPKKLKEKPKTVKKKPKEKPKKRVHKKKPVKKSTRASSQKSQANPNTVSKFHQKIRKKIDQNKFYPKIAKRRGMQGTVEVSFTILRSGKVSDIRIKGPKVFHSSVRHAIESAFPISVKSVPVSLPATIHIPLRYQIR